MEKKEKWLRAILTAATVLLLVLLAWQCLDIYLVGNSAANLEESGLYIQPVYRAEDVISRLSGLRFWAVGYFALLIAVCVLLPATGGKGQPVPLEPDNRLRLMKKKVDTLPEEACKEEQLRRKIGYVTTAVVLLCMFLALLFLLNRENFISWDLETVMGKMLLHTLPGVLVGFCAVIAASFLCRRSLEREIALLKGIPGTGSRETAEKTTHLLWVRICLYGIAAALIVLGIRNGGMRDVLIKAINICTECIGLG